MLNLKPDNQDCQWPSERPVLENCSPEQSEPAGGWLVLVGVGCKMADVDLWLDTLDSAFDNFDEEDADAAAQQRHDPILVPRIKYTSITPEEFEQKYSATNTPIILGDAFEPEGPVPLQFDLKFFKETYANELVPLDLNTLSEKVVKLGDYIEFSDEEMNKGYCRSLHTAEWFPDVNKHLRFPKVMVNPVNYLTQPGQPGFEYPEAWSRWFELFISNRDCIGFPFLHQDMCATHAFSMQVQGIKRFVLFPPSDSQYLYTFGNTGTRSAVPHAEIVTSSVSATEFPLYYKASLHIADLRPGDVFFCPSNWWHTTVVKSAEPSVTFGGNYVDNSNKDEFLSKWREYVSVRNLVASGPFPSSPPPTCRANSKVCMP